jgi:amino acid transporter
MFFSKMRRILIGSPLHSSQHKHELIPKWKALPVLAADALSSVAYATEEIVIPLALIAATIPFATHWLLPIAGAIVVLMFIVAMSYRETIHAYPQGGGAYIVVKENLGQGAGLVAGAALLIDYILTVAVSVSAGVENLISAFPQLASVQIFFCIWIILILMTLNLRGIGESSTVFAIPTYFFIFSIGVLIVNGLLHNPHEGVNPISDVLETNYPEIGIILILKAFSSGCAALTGIEAVSDAVPLFREPKAKNAKTTLMLMVGILALLFFGVSYLVYAHNLTHVEGVTLISQLNKLVFGSGVFFYIVQVAVVLILFLAASTAYADFPRVASLLAKDRYAPRQFASIGDRLVFSNGIIGLSLIAILLIIFFKGRTHYLIPLYSVGVFLSFTLSQSGMVIRHFKLRQPGWKWSIGLNAFGMICTAIVLCVVASFKFSQGAWVVVIVIPAIVYMFHRIHVHYVMFAREISQSHYDMPTCEKLTDHVVVIPISGIHRGVMNAIRYGMSISHDLRVCYVKSDEESYQRMLTAWNDKFPNLKLHVLESPYRSISGPILDYIDQVSKEHPTEFVTVIFPEFLTAKWHHQLLHNQTAWLIKLSLIYRKNVVVTSVKYHLTTT